MDAKRKVFVVLGAFAVIATAAIGGGELFFAGSDKLTALTSTSQTSASQQRSRFGAVTNAQSTSTSYKDGTYTASSSYFVPHGGENSIKTTLSVTNGTVTAVSVSDDYSDRESAAYVDWFEQELQGSVVGKSLANLSPSRIGGASLTTDAFDQTLDTIKNDATA